MRSFWLGVTGAILLAGSVATAAVAGDPFEDARYYVTIDDAKVLALVDGGQVRVTDTNAEGYTLLHYAADANRLALVKALIERGADPKARAKSGSTPSDMATNSAVKLALAGAGRAPAPAPMPVGPGPWPAAQPVAGNAPAGGGICAAVRDERVNNGRAVAVRPRLRARDDVWYNKPDELTALLDDCVDANSKDPNGSTLLHTAAERDRVDAARILLAHGANRGATDAQGKVAAAYATSAEMRALLGAAPAAAVGPDAQRKIECQQKEQADLRLAYDGTMRMRALNKYGRCLKTGLYQ